MISTTLEKEEKEEERKRRNVGAHGGVPMGLYVFFSSPPPSPPLKGGRYHGMPLCGMLVGFVDECDEGPRETMRVSHWLAVAVVACSNTRSSQRSGQRG